MSTIKDLNELLSKQMETYGRSTDVLNEQIAQISQKLNTIDLDPAIGKIREQMEQVLPVFNQRLAAIYAQLEFTPSKSLQQTVRRISSLSLPFSNIAFPFFELDRIAERAFIRLSEADSLLESTPFAWCTNLFSISDYFALADLVKAGQKDIANGVMIAIADDTKVHREMLKVCGRLPVLAPRVTALRQALRAHRRGDYYVSVPTCILHIEGILKAFGIEHRECDPEVLRDSRKTNFANLPEMVGVLESKEYEDLMKFYSKDYKDLRHAILHGWNTDYGDNPIFATQVIWMLLFTVLDIGGKLQPHSTTRLRQFRIQDYMPRPYRT